MTFTIDWGGSYELRLHEWGIGCGNKGSSNTVQIAGPTEVNRPSLSASPSSVDNGQAVTIRWSGLPRARHWIKVFPAGAADSSQPYQDLGETGFQPEGSVTFTPSQGGSYEVRILHYCPSWRSIASAGITVNGKPDGLHISPSQAAAGATLTGSWKNNPQGDYWIGLYRSGDPDYNYRQTWSTDRQTSGSMTFTIDWSGSYELRLHRSDGSCSHELTSNSVTIQGPTESLSPWLKVNASTINLNQSVVAEWGGMPRSAHWLYLYRIENGIAKLVTTIGGTGQQVSGSHTVTPSERGDYEICLYRPCSWDLLATAGFAVR